MRTKISCVMLIDDHHPTNVLHRLAIKNTNQVQETLIFDSGFDALNYLTQPFDLQHPKPDIIFLDINMPGMTGWEFLDKYKNLPLEKRLEILLFMLSTSSHPDDINRSKNEPIIKDYLFKPLTEEMIQEVIQKFFVIAETASK